MMTSEQIFCKAQWIWPVNGYYHLHNSYALFRRCFSLEALPKKALAHLTADQSYQLFVNGQLVCRGPARGYQAAWPFDSVDIAAFLRKGKNCIAIRAYNPGHGTFAYHSLGMAGILFAAKIGRKSLVSDNSWRCRHQTGVRRDTVPYSMQLTGHQEWIDLRGEAPAWSRPSFKDTDWNSAIHARGWNHPPHTGLEPRGIPMMRETVLRPKLIGVGKGKMQTDWESPICLADLRKRENLEHQLPTGKSTTIGKVPAGKKGLFQSFLLDFGKVVVGSPVLSIKGAKVSIDSFESNFFAIFCIQRTILPTLPLSGCFSPGPYPAPHFSSHPPLRPQCKAPVPYCAHHRKKSAQCQREIPLDNILPHPAVQGVFGKGNTGQPDNHLKQNQTT